MKISIGFILFLLLPHVSLAPNLPESPPLNSQGYFEEKGACPFECCTYRDWQTTDTVPVFDKPFGKQTKQIPEGVWVQAITGIVYSKPVGLEVIQPHSVMTTNPKTFAAESLMLNPGDKLYFLSNLGEGYVSAWYKGQILPVEAYDIFRTVHGPYKECKTKGSKSKKSCWIRPLGKNTKLSTVWWAKIRLEDGTEGWVSPRNFRNIDACG